MSIDLPKVINTFGDTPVGWVCSNRVKAEWAWVANLYVNKAYRHRGIGRALMLAMLRADARRGVRHSVLTASAVGALLYRKIGYEQVRLLQMFMPKK